MSFTIIYGNDAPFSSLTISAAVPRKFLENAAFPPLTVTPQEVKNQIFTSALIYSKKYKFIILQ